MDGLLVHVLDQEQPCGVIPNRYELDHRQPPEVVSIESVYVVEEHYCEHANQSRQEISAIVAGEHACDALESDEELCEAQPISSSPARFLDYLVNILVHFLVDDLLFEAVDLRPLVFELNLFVCLFLDVVKSQAQIIFALCLEVKEAVRSLKLIQISLNVVVIVNVLLDLGSPLPTLLIIHEILTVHVIKVDAHLGAEGISIGAGHLGLVAHIEVKPQLLHFNRILLHVVFELTHQYLSAYASTKDFGVNYLQYDLIIVIIHFKLNTLIVNWVLM